jgi:hypothetical protein
MYITERFFPSGYFIRRYYPSVFSQGRNAPADALVLLLTSGTFVSRHQLFAGTSSGLYA